MKYEHPTITIDSPAPGHFVISGHSPASHFVEGVGHVVPLRECYISPEIPTEALLAIIKERGDHKPAAAAASSPEKVKTAEKQPESSGDHKPTVRRKRRSKAQIAADAAKETK